MKLEERIRVLESEAKKIMGKKKTYVYISPLIYASLVDILRDLKIIKNKLEINE